MDNNNMKIIKFVDRKTIKIKTETITQRPVTQKWKGYTIGNIPSDFGLRGDSWFNYKGLTYIQE